jgi:hypothetical protein
MNHATRDSISAGTAYALVAAGGALLWVLTSLISGRPEAWDAPFYWTVSYPLAILLAGVVGYLAPHRAWRWGLVVMLVQALVMVVTSSGSFGLLPLGLLLLGVLSLPATALAVLVAMGRTRWGRG